MTDEIKKTNAVIAYNVLTECPECGGYLDLTNKPYDNDDEDLLGLYVFGGVDQPARWDDIELKYTCKHCHKPFIVDRLIY